MIKPRIFAVACFILSGAASISYQLIWLRDAISHFGVITPVISILLSVFMLGLGIGTWLGGRRIGGLSVRDALFYYAMTELGIAVLALSVPALFHAGYGFLLGHGTLGSAQYLFLSALIIAAVLLPACILIGATLPLMMKILEHYHENQKNFGVLYFANFIGALIGCGLPLLLIEMAGLKAALYITAALNVAAFLLAAGFLYLTRADILLAQRPLPHAAPAGEIAANHKIFLFLTGFAAIGSELLWIKAFTPVTGSNVYAYAIILGVYLSSNIAGSFFYLRASSEFKYAAALALMPFAALLVIFSNTVWVLWHLPWLMIVSTAPLSFLLGYLTTSIIDRSCAGRPHLIARSYTYNFAGCIMGPLLTGYFLFPLVGLKLSFIVHAVILAIAAWLLLPWKRLRVQWLFSMAFLGLTGASLFMVDYEDMAKERGVLYRDWVGYVTAMGEGMDKNLSINGIGMTIMTTITKNMIHLPAVYHHSPRKVLIICMGMGTTLRSAVAWPFESITQVELSRAVPRTFPYFHQDAQRVLDDPRVNIVIDDGRRFLLRNPDKYDIITIDPPPPIVASGSGLLYSTDFIEIIASRLNEGGILAHWVPHSRSFLTDRIISAIVRHFKYIRVLKSVEGWGIHILASNSPMPSMEVQAYRDRLPEEVKRDLMEYHPDVSIETVIRNGLNEETITKLLYDLPPPLSDDRLYNEFYFLRRHGLMPASWQF